MKFILIVVFLILVAFGALFVIKNNDALLLTAIAAVIVGFWFAVFQIPQEPDS